MSPLVQDVDMEQLLEEARRALESAYAPYSEYAVGAALRTGDGSIYTGCNIENANYSNSLHAEEVAIGSAVSDGNQSFERLAVVSAAMDGVTPCGMCRQTLAEFCGEDFEIICGTAEGTKQYTLGELLPAPISGTHLGAAGERKDMPGTCRNEEGEP